MKIVIACDSFKGCLTSKEVASCIEKGIHNQDINHNVISYVIGDGGEGTVDAFYETCHGTMVEVDCLDAYMHRIKAPITLIEDGQTAVIEVANIIGLSMCERSKRAPLFTSSYGVGMMIKAAVERGCKKIIIGLGGSSTNDGGMGVLMALGARFYDENHKPLLSQALSLEKIKYIDLKRMHPFVGVELIAACDVKNHLLGEQGATTIFGKQKGLFPNQIKKIERGMANYRYQLLRYTNIDIDAFEGGGAAGGIGSILIGLLHAQMIPGIELLLRYSDMEEKIKECDLLITGEGQSDRQTKYGKVPAGIIEIANRYQKPTICISGALGLEYMDLYELGFVGIYSIADRAMTFEQALSQAPAKLEAATYGIMKTISYFKESHEN
ncbi:MAG: glycerate kinase [Erysipelotrichaceae bacterium]